MTDEQYYLQTEKDSVDINVTIAPAKVTSKGVSGCSLFFIILFAIAAFLFSTIAFFLIIMGIES